jgi:hypothetical protein
MRFQTQVPLYIIHSHHYISLALISASKLPRFHFPHTDRVRPAITCGDRLSFFLLSAVVDGPGGPFSLLYFTLQSVTSN